MNKKYLSVVLFGALLLGTAGTFTSCKDYDDDIENLQGQITAMKGTVDQLEQKIKDGLVVTKVEKVADGVSITFSNGQTFKLENGAKGDKGDTGATGAAGKDADVWTIGQDGYWYKNDKPTEYVAVPSVTSGTDGRTLFYKPNTETECFDLYEIKDGKEVLVETTNISYVAKNGLSVVHNGNTLIINGAVDGEGNPAGPVTLKLGEKLASIAFVPEFLDQYSKYPITKFYHIEKYLSEDKYFTTGTLATEKWDFKPQDDYDKSNEVKMTYRVNPNGAYLQDVVLSFINRKITTTKTVDGDMSNLMNRVAGTEVISEETITTNATLNASQRKEANASTNPATFDLVALQAAVGAVAPVTSDYTAVRSEEIKPYLVDTKQTTATSMVEYFNRKKAIVGDNEDDNFVKKFVPIVTDVTAPNAIPAHLKFAYKDEAGNPGKIDLKDKVALYGKKADGTALGYLKDLGFTGIRYEFSLPKEYKAADQNNTNQQWFVDLDNDGVLSVNAANLNNNLTPAIGRRPVVRVDAFMKNNAGEEKLVASSYIRLEIVEFLLEGENNIVLNNEQFYEYHNLGTAYTSVANMSWQRINNEIYGVEHLTANTFWNYYGGTATPRTYEVKVITYDKATGDKKTLLNDNAVPANTAYQNNTSIPGIELQIKLNATDVTTSYIKVGVNNLVKTENTYKDMGNGAKYEVTITINPNDPTQHRKFILTQVFDVVDDCQFYKFNPLYHFTSWGAATGNFIKVKGKVGVLPGAPTGTPASWKIISELPEHFEMINGQNIFGYYKTTASPVKNVAATTNNLKFMWNATNGQNALPAGEINEGSTDMMLRLDHAMKDAEEIKQMDYRFTLVNGEECKTSYNVVFVNPFKSGGIQGVSLNGNGIGAQTVETRTQISVIDNENDEIFKWYDVDAEHATAGLYRTDKCKNTYKVARPTVAYAWVTDAAYYALKNQMTANSTLDCNATTGLITWDNDGATLQNVHNLKVKATVTFADLSIVEVIIPVTIKTAE